MTIRKILAIAGLFVSLILFTTCDGLYPGLGPAVDINAPRIGISSHINGSYISGTITLAGYVEDDTAIDRVVVTGSGLNLTADYSNGNWSVDIDTTPAGEDLANGEHEFTITATDTAGKDVQVKIFLIVDNGPPTVLMTTPREYAIQDFNRVITIKGEATDTTRVLEVRVGLFDDSDDSPVFENRTATGTTSWYLTFNSEGEPWFNPTSLPLDGQYYVVVTAEDYSGNTNSYFYHFDDLLSIAVDPANTPNIEEVHAEDNEGADVLPGTILSADLNTIRKDSAAGSRVALSIDPNSDSPQFTFISPDYSVNPGDNILSSPQRLSGFVEDDDGVNSSTLEIALWDFADNPDTVDPPTVLDWTGFLPTGNQWTYNTALPDGEYWMKLRVADIYGTTAATLPAAFRVSSFAPVANFTSPVQGSYVGNGSSVDLRVHVTGMGSGTVEIDPNGDDDYSDAIAMTENPPASGDWELTVVEGVDFSVPAGSRSFKVRAGAAGNWGTASLQYTRDTALPTVSVEVPPAGSSVNGTFNILGTSSDNNLVNSVYLWVEEDAVPSLPADPLTWLIPDTTDVYNWIRGLDTTALNAGAHTIHVTAFDAAGNRSAPYSRGFTVDQESDRPVITFTNLTEGGVSLDNSLGQNAEFIGYIEDDDNVDVSTLRVRIDLYADGLFPGIDLDSDTITDPNESENWETLSGAPGTDGRVVNWKHSIANLPQGEHAMWVRVFDVDDTSSGTDTNELTNPNFSQTVETRFIVDYGPPDLTITQPANNSVFNSDFSIVGTAVDPNGIFDVDIAFNGGPLTSILLDPVGTINAAWNYDFTVNPDGSDDGNYAYQVAATDMSGGQSTIDRQLIVDATAPTVAVDQPSALQKVNGTGVVIRGTADDREVSAVYIDINPSGSGPTPADPTLWDYTAAGTYSWSRTFNSLILDGDETPSDWDIAVKAADSAGNYSLDQTITVSIDQTSDRPVIDFNDIDKDETVAGNNVLVGATTLTGIIEDDDLIDPSRFGGQAIEISMDGAPWTAVSNPPAASGKIVVWKHSIAALLEGIHRVKLRVRDSLSDGTVGSSSASPEYTSNFNWGIEDSSDQNGIPFILNLGPPNIVIDGPPNYSYHSVDVLIEGSATDANAVKIVEISFDNGTNWIMVEDRTGVPVSPLDWDYTLTVDGSNDGTYSYLIRATDAYDSTSIENGQFTVDATQPSAIINQPGSAAVVNGEITLSGTASDNISLMSVYYSILPSTDPLPNFPTAYTLLASAYSWTDTFDTVGSPDVSHTLRIVAVDTAGNTSDTVTPISRTFTVNQESDRPVIGYSSITEAGTFIENLLPGSKQIAGTIIDDDAVDAVTVEYRLYDETGTVLQVGITPDWTPVTGQPAINSTLATWTNTLGAGVTDGKYQIELRAADINDAGTFIPGGFGWAVSPKVRLAVDTANPETTFTSPASNGGFTNTDFTVGGEASDAGGVKRVQIQYNGGPQQTLYEDLAATSNSYVWSDSFDVDEAAHTDDGIVYYTVTVTDAYDKIKTVDRYINVDTRDPVINSLNLVNNDQTGGGVVNGSVLLQGSPIDNETLVDGIFLRIATGPAPAEPGVLPVVPGGDPEADWILLPSTTSINYRFDSSDFADLTLFTAYFLVRDKAGNLSAVGDYTLDFTPIQAGNNPVITISTPDGTLLKNADSVSGAITDDDGVDVSTIQINFNGSGWIPVTTKSASNSTSVVFSHSMASVPEQVAAHSIQVRVADIGEDFVDDSQDIPAAAAVSSAVSIFVDDSDPTAVINLIDNGQSSSATIQGIYINDQFTITGTSTDGVQVSEVRAKISGDADFTVVNDTGTDFSTWDWSRTGLSIGAASTVLTLEVEDIHGRITPYSYTILVDEAPPTAAFITTTGTYHRDLTIRGTSGDNILVSSVYLAEGSSLPAAPVGGDPSTDPDYVQLGSTYSWTYILDTYALYSDDQNHTHYASIVSVDGAGNVSPKVDLSFVINQASDQPSIDFSNVDPADAASDNLLESNAKVLGSAGDDDGLSTIEIASSADDITYSAWAPITTDGTTPVAVSGLNLNWQSFVADLGEGVHYVKFRVRDNQFVDTPTTPYNEAVSETVALTIDTGAPSVSIAQFDIDNAYGAGMFTKAAAPGVLINNSFLVSGTVTDGNLLNSVRISTDGTNYTDVDTLAAPDWSHTIPIVHGSGTSDGTLTIYITAVDQFLKSTTITLPVTIDTLEPVIIPTQPSGMDLADPPNVNGPVTLRGSIAEVSAITGFSAIAGIADDVSLTNSGTDLNWVLDVDTDLYADGSYSVETVPGSSNIWRFPIDVSASDAAGNQALELFRIDIDPNSDKPVLYLTAPSDASSVAGAFIVQGTVTDDDDIQKITLQVDLDDDGVYTSVYDLDGDSTAGNSDFEDESVPVDVSVTNGSWNMLMNQLNEFSKTNLIAAGFAGADGWIRIRAVPYDVDAGRSGLPNLAGDSVEVRIYVDSTAPIIEGQGVPLPTPANGSIVRGIVTIQSRFKDDKTLANNRMQISFDGGSTFASVESAGGTITPNGLVGDYYEYDIDLPVDTTVSGGIVTGGNGILQAVLRVTDDTFKQNTMAIQLNVDNTLPTGLWNYNSDLPDVGGVYSFYGNAAGGGDYLLIGSAEDGGTISGVERVEVYFVKNGKFYNPLVDNSTVENDTLAVSTSSVPDMSGTPQVIPYTSNPNYVINIDNRAERGLYDTDPTDGDNDGFQESLRSKGTFDEWFVYFDATRFPDGPTDMYTVVYDTAGNYAFEQVDIQIVNNPPTIDSVEIDDIAYTGLFKRANLFKLEVIASDAEGINPTTYKATVTSRRIAPNGAVDVNPTPVPTIGTEIDIANTGDGTDPTYINLNISGWDSGIQYTLEIEVRDTDGNIVQSDIELWVNNFDATAPTVQIDDLDQTNLTGQTGHIDEAGFSTNDGAFLSPNIGSVAGDRKSFTSADLIGNGTIQAGWTTAFGTGEWRTITSFNTVSGTVSWSTALTQTPTGTARVQAGQADISGVVNITGIAHDDTTVSSVEISFNNGVNWYTTDTLTQTGGDIIAGFDYTWSYSINTGDPAVATAWTDAALNRTVMVRADDGPNIGILTAAGTSSDMVVDVVPYVTRIERLTAGLRTNRSRFGRYSIYQNESNIRVSGFNLNPASAALVNDPAAPAATDSLTVSGIAADSTNFLIATDTNTRSGWLRIQVDGIDAVNNLNDNGRSYNNLYGTDGSDEDWSDDRYFFLFETGDYFGTAFTGVAGFGNVNINASYNPRFPAMTMHPDTSRLFGAWSYFGNSDVFFASVNSDANVFQSRVYHTYDTAESVDIAMDQTSPASSGRLALAWLSNNSSSGSYADGHVTSFPYERDTGFLNGDVENDGAANLPSDQAQWTRDQFSNWYYQGEGLGYDEELEQFTEIRTARAGNNIHWAYHDTISNTVKYQHEVVTTTIENELPNWINIDGPTGDTDGGEDTREVANGIARTADAGEFLALALDEDYYPVVVYYDNIGKTLRLARTGSAAPGNDETLWTRQDVFSAGDPNKDLTGKHISAIVDTAGYLHISFWSEDTGYLYYIRSSNNPEGGAAYEFNDDSQIVDDTGTAGTYSDLTLNRSTNQPFIAYLNSARVNTRDGIKFAYYDAALGGWEYVVPANSTVVSQKRISMEYAGGGTPPWEAAFGYASDVRFEVNYLMPEVF